jgi:pimeloyl-ACP methyl ester carboxylesterase
MELVIEELRFRSSSGQCAATLIRPGRVTKPPLVLMGHGLGATREMGLQPYAERFAEAGIASLAFTYRHFGDSTGWPRQLLMVGRQLDDWCSALRFARDAANVDSNRIALWGTSFGAGHALVTASRDPGLRAVVAQCPFTDGLASTAAIPASTIARLALLGLRDMFAAFIHPSSPVAVPLVGPPGSTALMSAPDAAPGMFALTTNSQPLTNAAAARVALRIPLYRPGCATRRITAPVLFCVAEDDSVAPAAATIRHARRAPISTILRYPVKHFDFYAGPTFEQVVADQAAFLQRHLEVAS